MINLERFIKIFIGILFFTLLSLKSAEAQVQGNQWTLPQRLSSEEGDAIGSGSLEGMSGVAMVTDEYGYMHVFWGESGFPDERMIIQHTRYDGEKWSLPIDIYSTQPGDSIGVISAAVDKGDILHLIWSEGFGRGPVYYMNAMASN